MYNSKMMMITKFRPIFCGSKPLARLIIASQNQLSRNFASRKMPQVEVDEPDVQKQLGDIQMVFVKKAEERNRERASRHRKFRRGDWTIAGVCFFLAVSIYAYTIYAIKQESFLDDFEMPDDEE